MPYNFGLNCANYIEHETVNTKEVKNAFETIAMPLYNQIPSISKSIIKYQSFVSLVKWFFNDFLERGMRKIISVHRRALLCALLQAITFLRNYACLVQFIYSMYKNSVKNNFGT